MKHLKITIYLVLSLSIFNLITLFFVSRFHENVVTFMKAVNSTQKSFLILHDELIRRTDK